MWTYVQKTGAMLDTNGNLLAAGYAGNGLGKNNPAAQHLQDVGPIPVGTYTIEPAVDTKTHGPQVMWLSPDPSNEMCGRSGFGIHGDSVTDPGSASEGCIILPRKFRDMINASDDKKLRVIAYYNEGGPQTFVDESE